MRGLAAEAISDTLSSDPVLQEHGIGLLLDPQSDAWQTTGAAEKERALVAAMRPWFDWRRTGLVEEVS